MSYKRNKCSCGGYFSNGVCVDCDSPAPKNFKDSFSDKPITGPCSKCSNEGTLHGDRYLCMSCSCVPIWCGVEHPNKIRVYESREEAMYYKAKYVYQDNPRYLGKEVNDRVVAIAYDRWMSKKYGRNINRELWDELPIDVL